jgi:hypothetical protein
MAAQNQATGPSITIKPIHSPAYDLPKSKIIINKTAYPVFRKMLDSGGLKILAGLKNYKNLKIEPFRWFLSSASQNLA